MKNTSISSWRIKCLSKYTIVNEETFIFPKINRKQSFLLEARLWVLCLKVKFEEMLKKIKRLYAYHQIQLIKSEIVFYLVYIIHTTKLNRNIFLFVLYFKHFNDSSITTANNRGLGLHTGRFKDYNALQKAKYT